MATLGVMGLGWAGPARGATVAVCPQLEGQGPPPASFEVVAESVVVQGEEPKIVRATGKLGEGARLSLEGGQGWSVHLEAEGFWSPTTVLVPSGAEEVLQPRLFPLGEVHGRVQRADGGEPPPEITLRLRQSAKGGPQERESLEETWTCRVESGRWQCALPAGRWDLRLRARGMVSHYLWELEIPPRQELDLGTFSLIPGASIVGWVEVDDGEPLAPESKVRLELATGELQARQARLGSVTETTPIQDRGFFHFEGLGAGSYRLEVEQEGYSTARSDLIAVFENTEIELRDPLRLVRPLLVQVAVTPGTDVLGEPWKVLVVSPRRIDPVAQKVTDESGVAQLQGIDPGNYLLMVYDSQGAKVAQAPVEVSPQSTRFPVELDLVYVAGRLLLGEEPLEARLQFGGTSGGASVAFRSDEEGRFGGLLPHAGSWEVDVRSSSPRIFRRLRKVEVEKDASGMAELEIILPDTSLAGEVVDERGESVPGAGVLVTPVPGYEKPSSLRSDEKGRFEMRGGGLGTFRLEALGQQGDASLASDPIEVTLTKSSPVATVRLVARRSRETVGRVLSDLGPVPGAHVSVTPLTQGQAQGILVPNAISDPAGRFAVSVPAKTSEVQVTVMAVGFNLFRQTLPLPEDGGLVLHLAHSGGGTLELELGEAQTGWYDRPPPHVRHGEGLTYDLGTLSAWARAQGVRNEGSTLRVPGLPMGAYQLCWPTPPGSEGGAWGADCSAGTLLPSGTLSLGRESAEAKKP